MSDDDEPSTLDDAVRRELECLWDDLYSATRAAIRDGWSINCDHLRWRIETLTRFVGPLPWENVQIPLLESGVYQRIHQEMGVTVEVDMQRVAQVRARIDRRMSSLRPQS